MRLNDDVGSSGFVSVAAASPVVDTEVKTSVDPERNGKSVGVAADDDGSVASGAADGPSESEAEPEGVLGKLMMTVEVGKAVSGRLL